MEENTQTSQVLNCPLASKQQPMYYERFYQRVWRPAMAFLYMLLNFVDYVVRPAVNYYYMSRQDIIDILLKTKDLDTSIQLKLLDVISNGGTIPPILPEFVHLSFGAILGVAAFSRYQEKKKLLGN